MRLEGCEPRGGLLECVGRIGGRRAVAGSGWLQLLDGGGAAMGSYFVNEVTVVGVEPSEHGAGLLDLTVTLSCESAVPGADDVWELVRTGRLNRAGMWRDLDSGGRRAWLSVALWSHEYRRRGRSDASAGQVFTLDGRYLVDLDAFYCALGEAVNGPGGYFGWNLDALNDCLRGGWGATTPFELRWGSAAQSREHLAEPVPDGDRLALFDVLLELLEERGVSVVLC